jgi:hypothetical protein
MIFMVNTYVGLKNVYKRQIEYSLYGIQRSQQQKIPFVIYTHVLLYKLLLLVQNSQ